MSYIPKGCDQQGRYPQAAEASTEVGAEDDDVDLFEEILPALVALFLVGATALVVTLIAPFFRP